MGKRTAIRMNVGSVRERTARPELYQLLIGSTRKVPLLLTVGRTNAHLDAHRVWQRKTSSAWNPPTLDRFSRTRSNLVDVFGNQCLYERTSSRTENSWVSSFISAHGTCIGRMSACGNAWAYENLRKQSWPEEVSCSPDMDPSRALEQEGLAFTLLAGTRLIYRSALFN
jgi:hypothetical protein